MPLIYLLRFSIRIAPFILCLCLKIKFSLQFHLFILQIFETIYLNDYSTNTPAGGAKAFAMVGSRKVEAVIQR